MTRHAAYIRDPVSREAVAADLKHRIKLTDHRMDMLRLTALQQHHLEAERHILFILLDCYCGESYVRER